MLIAHLTKVERRDDVLSKVVNETALDDLLGDTVDEVFELILCSYQDSRRKSLIIVSCVAVHTL